MDTSGHSMSQSNLQAFIDQAVYRECKSFITHEELERAMRLSKYKANAEFEGSNEANADEDLDSAGNGNVEDSVNRRSLKGLEKRLATRLKMEVEVALTGNTRWVVELNFVGSETEL